MKTLHVLFVVNNYPPHVGGVERHVHGLASHLVKLGHQVTVVTLGEGPSGRSEDGIRVIRRRSVLPVGGVLSFALPGEARRVSKLAKQGAVDVISVHTRFFPMSLVGVRAAKRAQIPIIHTEHGSGFVKGVSGPVALASRIVDLTLGRYVLKASTRVVVVSEAVREFVRRLSGREAEVFYNAVDLDPWIHAASVTKAQSNRFVFLGRIVSGKGWETVVEAAVLLSRRGIAVEVDFIGAGSESENLKSRVIAAGLDSALRVHGQLSGDVLVRTVAGATLVNPTTLSEGFQTSLIEALGAGSRVITYDVPGAQLLKDEGAPVSIVHDRSAIGLADAMAQAMSTSFEQYPESQLEQWGWPHRAQQYVRIVEDCREGESVQKRR